MKRKREEKPKQARRKNENGGRGRTVKEDYHTVRQTQTHRRRLTVTKTDMTDSQTDRQAHRRTDMTVRQTDTQK